MSKHQDPDPVMSAGTSLVTVQAGKWLPRDRYTFVEASGNGAMDVAVIWRCCFPHAPRVDRQAHHLEGLESVAWQFAPS